MIARVWRGITRLDEADAYLEHIRNTIMPAVREQDGLIDFWTLKREQGDKCEFQLVTVWNSLGAMRDWAGKRPEAAVYFDEDERFLLDMEPLVRIYDIADHFQGASAAS